MKLIMTNLIIFITGTFLHLATSSYGLEFANIVPENRTLCRQGQIVPGNRVNTSEVVKQLRELMVSNSLDAYLIPYEDQHISDPAGHDNLLNFISGFSGSNGYAWVTGVKGQYRLAMWTDGRYFLQADQEMDCNWIMMKMSTTGYPTATEWLLEVLPDEAVVGIDPKLVSISRWKNYEEKLSGKSDKQIKIRQVENELIDQIWNVGRPEKPNENLIIHDIAYAGKNWTDKIADVRDKLTEDNVDVLFISALDEIAWLFNLRGFDRETSPYFFSYAMVLKSEIRLYLINVTKLLTEEIQQHLNTGASGLCDHISDDDESKKYCVTVGDYNNAIDDLAQLQTDDKVQTIWISPSSNYAINSASGNKSFEEYSPIQLMKSIKNDVERRRYFECQVRDSANLVEFVASLEKKIIAGEHMTELSAADMLRDIRKKDDDFRMVSFYSISAVGANAAVIHYRPTEETDTKITTNEIYLLDSGGNFLDGTTDVTRTFHFGTPTAREKEAYTRVLVGCIDLATAIWPSGKYGYQLDTLARGQLWKNGWDYNHGTGHGIGYFLNVHEGPGRISPSTAAGQTPLYDGMFFSDEPGYYEDEKFGIRLETIVGVEVVRTPNRFNDVDYLGFKPATLVPFEPKLINYDLLNAEHRQWLNAYNKRCREETGKHLKNAGKTEAYNWLISRTEHIPDQPIWETPNTVSASSSLHKNCFFATFFAIMGLLMITTKHVL